jgi:hypothetical protein
MERANAYYSYSPLTNGETEIASQTEGFPFGMQRHGMTRSIFSKLQKLMSCWFLIAVMQETCCPAMYTHIIQLGVSNALLLVEEIKRRLAPEKNPSLPP